MTTKTAQFTQGPWVVNTFIFNGKRKLEVLDATGVNACGQANAHLIAAAPAMYEALQSILEFYEWSNSNGAEQAAYDKAIAALAQAEGRHHE